MNVLLLSFIAAVIGSSVAQNGTYTGHKVIRVHGHSKTEFDIIKNYAENHFLDIWRLPRSLNETMDILLSPKDFSEIRKLMNSLRIDFSIMHEDLESVIEKERARNVNAKRQSPLFYSSYPDYLEIVARCQSIALGSSFVTDINIGSSNDGRDIRALLIGDEYEATKPTIIMEAMMHAREWIAPMTVLYIAEQLLLPENSQLIQDYNWHIIPISNPDGFEYTWSDDRFWRKTRSLNSGSSCMGTDGNRNFDYQWGGSSSDSSTCSTTYRGATPFSEIETQRLIDHIGPLSNKVMFYSVHSYGQYWLAPWGYSSSRPSDAADHDAVGLAATDAIQAVHGRVYLYGSAGPTLYTAYGISTDYTYAVSNIKHSYTLELRGGPGGGNNGFVLPADEIIPTGEETFAGVKAAVAEMEALNRKANIPIVG